RGRVAMAPAGGFASRLVAASSYGASAAAMPVASSRARVAMKRQEAQVSPPALERKLSRSARRRLASPLRALLQHGDAVSLGLDVADGKVRIEVTLRDTSAETLARLTALGLKISQVTDDRVIGTIAIDALAILAEDEEVKQIEPA
ncbi:MAG: hypothetical protein V3T01_12005, partial [Myxococcota bacterium]